MSAYRDDQRVSSAPENSGSNDGASRRPPKDGVADKP